MVFSAFRAARPRVVPGLLVLAAGTGALEGLFVWLIRDALGAEGPRWEWKILLLIAFGIVSLRSLLQWFSARLETSAVFSWIGSIREQLLDLLSARRVAAYRAPYREPLAAVLDRGLEDAAAGAAAGLRCHAAAAQAAILAPLLFLFSWKPALAALLLALPVLALSRFRSAALAASAGAFGASAERLAAEVRAFAEGLEGEAGNGRLAFRAGGLSESRGRHEGMARGWELSKALFPPLLEWLFFAALAALLALALPARGADPPWAASLLPFAALLLLLYRPLKEWARAYPARLPGDLAYGAYRNLRDTLEALPAVRPPQGSGDGLIRLEGVDFAYPGAEAAGSSGARPVFRGLTASLDPQAVTWIPGPNGSGKTTLLRLLAGIEWPDQGSILLPASLLAAARPFAYLPQRALLEPDYEDWARGFARESPEEWRTLDGILGLHALLHPPGGFRGEALSGGQRQRLALARVFASPAPCLLLDEPTTGLASGDRERIMGDLLAFRRGGRGRKGTGVVLVSHEPFLGEFGSATLRLDGTGAAAERKSGGSKAGGRV